MQINGCFCIIKLFNLNKIKLIQGNFYNFDMFEAANMKIYLQKMTIKFALIFFIKNDSKVHSPN